MPYLSSGHLCTGRLTLWPAENKALFCCHNPSVMPRDVKTGVSQRGFSTQGRGQGFGAYSNTKAKMITALQNIESHAEPRLSTAHKK